MRVAAGILVGLALWAPSLAWSQTAAQKTAAAPAPAPAAAPAAAAPMPALVAPNQPPQPPRAACNNPNALGVARTLEIDTTGGPGFGFEHFKELDFLKDKEVVLTFDDGPWEKNTEAVLKALADECTTGIFFEIGKHATYYPEIAKKVYAAGHTIGTHTWSHEALVNKKLNDDQRKEEIEKGISAVRWALGGVSPSSFFRFPALQHPPEMVTYLGQRNIAIFSCDVDSFDFKYHDPKKVMNLIFKGLEKKGKGIILMHDFHKETAALIPEVLARLKAEGYKVVAMRSKVPVSTIPQYDEALLKDTKLPTMSNRPVSSVVTEVPQ